MFYEKTMAANTKQYYRNIYIAEGKYINLFIFLNHLNVLVLNMTFKLLVYLKLFSYADVDQVSQCLRVKPVKCIFCLLNIKCRASSQRFIFLFFKYIDTLQAGLQRGNICISYNGFGRPTLAVFIHESLLHFGHQTFPLKPTQSSSSFLKHLFSSNVDHKA